MDSSPPSPRRGSSELHCYLDCHKRRIGVVEKNNNNKNFKCWTQLLLHQGGENPEPRAIYAMCQRRTGVVVKIWDTQGRNFD